MPSLHNVAGLPLLRLQQDRAQRVASPQVAGTEAMAYKGEEKCVDCPDELVYVSEKPSISRIACAHQDKLEAGPFFSRAISSSSLLSSPSSRPQARWQHSPDTLLCSLEACRCRMQSGREELRASSDRRHTGHVKPRVYRRRNDLHAKIYRAAVPQEGLRARKEQARVDWSQVALNASSVEPRRGGATRYTRQPPRGTIWASRDRRLTQTGGRRRSRSRSDRNSPRAATPVTVSRPTFFSPPTALQADLELPAAQRVKRTLIHKASVKKAYAKALKEAGYDDAPPARGGGKGKGRAPQADNDSDDDEGEPVIDEAAQEAERERIRRRLYGDDNASDENEQSDDDDDRDDDDDEDERRGKAALVRGPRRGMSDSPSPSPSPSPEPEEAPRPGGRSALPSAASAFASSKAQHGRPRKQENRAPAPQSKPPPPKSAPKRPKLSEKEVEELRNRRRQEKRQGGQRTARGQAKLSSRMDSLLGKIKRSMAS